MNFYLLFIVLLYVGGCSARVVPLNFKLDRCKRFVSSNTENELIDESPKNEAENLSHNLPDNGQSKDLEHFNSEEGNTAVPEISNRNSSNFSADSTVKEETMGEESNFKRNESSVVYYDPLEELKSKKRSLEELDSTLELKHQINSDSRNSSETIEENVPLNDKTEGLVKNETSSTINSSLDLEQRNNLDFVKTEEKVLNDTFDQSENFKVVESFHNETFAYFEVADSDQNETSTVFEVDGSNSAYLFELQPLPNGTKVDEEENTAEQFKSNNITSENLEPANDTATSAGGIFSGFEFLINSEVARNAAKAIEVFNFSDPLTDHIIEENEFHSFLPAFNPVQDLDSSSQVDLESTTNIANSSGESNEIQADFNASLLLADETSIALHKSEQEELEKNSSLSFNLSEPLVKGNKTEFFDLVEKIEGNVGSELSSSLEKSEEKIEISSESIILKENVTDTASNSSAVGVPECPPAGWCLLSFLSQDTCAVNEHCLGSRICCKIGCSKTCIEVKSA